MYTIRQPNMIMFGENAITNYSFPDSCLVITSQGAKTRGWLDYLDCNNSLESILKSCFFELYS